MSKFTTVVTTCAKRLVTALKRHRNRRDMLRVLNALDDRLLRDVGIDRHEIPLVVEAHLREYDARASMDAKVLASSMHCTATDRECTKQETQHIWREVA